MRGEGHSQVGGDDQFPHYLLTDKIRLRVTTKLGDERGGLSCDLHYSLWSSLTGGSVSIFQG